MADYSALSEKKNLEHSAIQKFASAMSFGLRQNKLIITDFNERDEKGKPDTICRLGSKTIGVEIAHVYGSGLDAMKLLGRELSSAQNRALAQQAQIPLDYRIPNSLNRILSKKSKKHYSIEPVWLLIRNAFPIWTRADFVRYRGKIVIPIHHRFERIWLLCGVDSRYGILRLY
jgi:hypothetical protein